MGVGGMMGDSVVIGESLSMLDEIFDNTVILESLLLLLVTYDL